MLVSVEYIRKNYGTIPMIDASDASVIEGVIDLANSVPLPIVFVTGGSSTHMFYTPKGAEYIVVRVDGNPSELEVYNSLRHELIHYDQVMRGDLAMSAKNGRTLWKGMEFELERGPITHKPTDPIAVAQNTLALVRYIAQPWEWEASQHELAEHIGIDVFNVLLDVYAEHGTVWSWQWSEYAFFHEIVRSGFTADAVKKAYADAVCQPY